MSQSNPTKSEIDKYAGHYVLHGDRTAAFRETFPDSKATKESTNTKASKLHSLVQVQSRIDELTVQARDLAEDKFKITVDSLLSELDEIKLVAMGAETPQCSAAVSSVMSKAKLVGLDIVKIEVSSKEELTPWGVITASADD